MITAFATRFRLILSLLALIAFSLPAAHGATISQAKLMGNGATVTIPSRIVTFVSADYFYIQETNSGISLSDYPIGGIRVNKTAHGLAVGARVGVTGAMRTNGSFERYLEASSVTNATGAGAVVPLAMSNKAVGGSDWNYSGATGAGQRGVDPHGGLNNIGMLIRTTGFVGYVDSTSRVAYVDDGSSLYDGNTVGPQGAGMAGIRVLFPSSLTLPKTTQYLTITGISSLELVAGSPARLILAQAVVREDAGLLMPDLNMLCVPGGDYLMGNSGTGDDAVDGYPREYPQHTVSVPTFWISKTEITRGQYNQFIAAGGYSNAAYWSGEGWSWKLSVGRTQPSYWSSAGNWAPYIRPDFSLATFTQTDNHPVVGVTYYEAEAFCNWAGGRLPTEAEWEKAARWDGTSRIYPWGNTMDKAKSSNWYETTYPGFQSSPVTAFAAGASPYGCLDMSGNVWEWTQDWYVSYPGSSSPFDKTGTAKALRGGSWLGIYGERCACRWFSTPVTATNDIGFRIAR